MSALRADGLAPFQRGKCSNGLAGFLFCQSQIIETLQIQPKLGARTEEMSEAESRVNRSPGAAGTDTVFWEAGTAPGAVGCKAMANI